MKAIIRNITSLLLAFCFIFTNVYASDRLIADNLINTGEFLTLVINALGYNQKSDAIFNDVPEYNEVAAKVIAAGLVTHTDNSSLNPKLYLNKSTALSILTVALRAEEGRVKEVLGINSLSDGRSNITDDFADKVIKELMGTKISRDSVYEKNLGTAYITKKGTKVENLTCDTLLIAPSVENGNITISNSNINNLVILKDGANNVTVQNSNIGYAIVANENASFSATGTTIVDNMIINVENVLISSDKTSVISEISLEHQPSLTVVKGKFEKSKQLVLESNLKLEGEFGQIKITDNISKLNIAPQKDSSDIKISSIQLNKSEYIQLQIWYKASIKSVGLANGSKWKGSATIEIQNSRGVTARKDTVTTLNALNNAFTLLINEAILANVDSEMFAGHDVSDKTVSYGTKIEHLDLPKTVKLTSNLMNTATGEISWNYGKYDSKAPGKYVITGTVSCAGIVWAPEKIDITVVVEEMLTYSIPHINLVVRKDTSLKELQEELLPQTVTATLSNGSTVTVLISDWECEGKFDPNPQVSTNYFFTGNVSRLPASAGNYGKVTATVVVQLNPLFPFD